MPDMPSRRTILFTGAAEFVGFHLARGLLDAGETVVGIDNMNAYNDVSLKQARMATLQREHPAFVFEQKDLTDRDNIGALFARDKPEIFVHLAAQAGVRYSLDDPHSYVSSNIDGFLTILEAYRTHPVRHLIYASSISVYGATTRVPFHEDDAVLKPVSLYAVTKLANELMAATYAHMFATPLSGLRFFTVHGPWGRPGMAYFSFIGAIVEGREIEVFNEGQMRREFTYIDDVVEAIHRPIDIPPQEAAPKIVVQLATPQLLYNIGNHTPVELLAFIEAIEAALGEKAKKRHLPMQPGDVPATFADIERLSRVTGLAPRTPLKDGIWKFVAGYRDHYQ